MVYSCISKKMAAKDEARHTIALKRNQVENADASGNQIVPSPGADRLKEKLAKEVAPAHMKKASRVRRTAPKVTQTVPDSLTIPVLEDGNHDGPVLGDGNHDGPVLGDGNHDGRSSEIEQDIPNHDETVVTPGAQFETFVAPREAEGVAS
jgi:hypothetical protein